jgi:hypothetical protein
MDRIGLGESKPKPHGPNLRDITYIKGPGHCFHDPRLSNPAERGESAGPGRWSAAARGNLNNMMTNTQNFCCVTIKIQFFSRDSDDLGSHAQKALPRNSLSQPNFPSGVNLLPIDASGGLFAGPNHRNSNSPKRANKAPGQSTEWKWPLLRNLHTVSPND